MSKVVFCRIVEWGKGSYRRFLTPLQQTAFWKHSNKRRNCTKHAISPFVTMFFTFSLRLSIQLWRFSIFWQRLFKVVCCRIALCEKGLNESTIIELVWKHVGDQRRNCLFWAIFSLLTWFRKDFCNRGVRKHLYEGKG